MGVGLRVKLQGQLPQLGEARNLFRDIVGHRLRRRMEKVLADAQRNTPYPDIASQYYIQQRSEGANFSVGIGNRHPIFGYLEYGTRAHWPPWGQGTRLAAWSEARGLIPFMVARSIASHDQPPKKMLNAVWERSADDINSTIDAALDAWLQRLFGD